MVSPESTQTSVAVHHRREHPEWRIATFIEADTTQTDRALSGTLNERNTRRRTLFRSRPGFYLQLRLANVKAHGTAPEVRGPDYMSSGASHDDTTTDMPYMKQLFAISSRKPEERFLQVSGCGQVAGRALGLSEVLYS